MKRDGYWGVVASPPESPFCCHGLVQRGLCRAAGLVFPTVAALPGFTCEQVRSRLLQAERGSLSDHNPVMSETDADFLA